MVAKTKTASSTESNLEENRVLMGETDRTFMTMFSDTVRRARPAAFWMAGALIVLTMTFALLGWMNGRPLGVRRADVAMVQMQPVPEGPGLPTFSRTGQYAARPLSEIEAFIPDPLPHSVGNGTVRR
jgi:hypothetical protein